MKNFLDIDVIMSEEDRIPCKFTNEDDRDGFMDPQAESDVDELPFWLADKFHKMGKILPAERILTC